MNTDLSCGTYVSHEIFGDGIIIGEKDKNSVYRVWFFKQQYFLFFPEDKLVVDPIQKETLMGALREAKHAMKCPKGQQSDMLIAKAVSRIDELGL